MSTKIEGSRVCQTIRCGLMVGLSFVVLLLGIQAPAHAFSSFRTTIPNGFVLANNGCGTCHSNPSGGVDLNDFGLDYQANSFVWNAPLASIDSDGDGCSNGAELLDPNALWSPGAANPGDSALVTAPGDFGDAPIEPIAIAAPVPAQFVGDIVDLTANVSNVSNAVFYRWTLNDAPPGSATAIADRNAQSTSLTLDVEGTYVVSVAARNDGCGPFGLADTTNIVANASVPIPLLSPWTLLLVAAGFAWAGRRARMR